MMTDPVWGWAQDPLCVCELQEDTLHTTGSCAPSLAAFKGTKLANKRLTTASAGTCCEGQLRQGSPARDTVAGVAMRRWLISNSSLIVGFRRILSLLARVSTCTCRQIDR